MEPILSIIILQYNNHKYFKSLFESITKQATFPVELIVADDCSKDGFNKNECLDIISKSNNKNIINCIIQINSQNVGTVKNINLALTKASGDFVKMIAVDDSFPLDNEIIKEQCDYLTQNPEKSFVLSNIMTCDNNLNPLFSKSIKDIIAAKSNYSQKKIFKKIIRGHTDLFAIQSICFRKTFFDSFSFDERLRLIEDLPFIVWSFANKAEFGHIDKIGVLYRSDVGVSTTTETFSSKKMMYYLDLQSFYNLILKPYKKDVGSIYFWTRKSVIDFRIKYTNNRNIFLIFRYFVPLVLYFFYCPQNAKKHYKNRG